MAQKFDEVGTKTPEEIEAAELEKHQKDLKNIGNGLDRSEKEKDRNEEELQKLLAELAKLN